jgi:hypothetical protein
MMETLSSSETSVLTRVTRCNIPEAAILQRVYVSKHCTYIIPHYLLNTQTLIDASKEVSLEVNVEKTKYMLVSRDQNAGPKSGNKNRKQII